MFFYVWASAKDQSQPMAVVAEEEREEEMATEEKSRGEEAHDDIR